MTATFSWKQTIGDASNPQEVSATNLNLVNTYQIANADPSDYPITAGENSYELWVRPHFKGTWTEISDIRFSYISGSLLSGESLYCSWIQPSGLAYQTPTKQKSTIAVSALPMGTEVQVGISGSTTTKMTSNALNTTSGQWADWIILQLQTSSNMPAGLTNTKTFKITYTEV